MGPKTIIFNHGDKALNVSSAKVAVGLFWAESWLFWSHFLRYRLQVQYRGFFKVSVA